MRERLRDERGIIGSSLAKYAIFLILGGLVAIEGGSVIFTTITLQNNADGAAVAAAEEWGRSGNARTALAAARTSLDDKQEQDASIDTFEADGPPSFEVRITVSKQASTLLIHRIGFLEGFANVDVEAEARTAGSGV